MIKLLKHITPSILKNKISRWRFVKTKPIDFDYLELIHQQSPDTLTDAYQLENFLPTLGLNDENLEEFPEELYPCCGYGLRHWQYPKQFSPYLIHLSQYPIRSYLEIGVRHGGTFLITINYLQKSNAIQRAYAIDIVKNNALRSYCEQNTELQFLRMNSNSKAFATFIAKEKPIDLILIDGNHEEKYCRKDFETVKNNANMIAFHDIVSDSCPGVIKVWKEVKKECGKDWEFYEFTEQYESVQQRTAQSFLGIGLAIRKDFIKNEKEEI